MKKISGIFILSLIAVVLVSCFGKNYDTYTGPPPREGPLEGEGAGGYQLSSLPESLAVEFVVPEGAPCSVKVELRNLGTKLVRTVIDSVYSPGAYKLWWDRLDSAGVRIRPKLYYYKYYICDSSYTERMDYRYHWE